MSFLIQIKGVRRCSRKFRTFLKGTPKTETEKRLLQIGRIAKKENILFWSDGSLKNLFKEAKSQGEDRYKIKGTEN